MMDGSVRVINIKPVRKTGPLHQEWGRNPWREGQKCYSLRKKTERREAVRRTEGFP